jgi:hypothetical protein
MDFWRCLLAIAQVAAVQIDLEEVNSAPMARFHRVGEVFPDTLYGHIIVTFDVAELRGQMKDLQEVVAVTTHSAENSEKCTDKMKELRRFRGKNPKKDVSKYGVKIARLRTTSKIQP